MQRAAFQRGSQLQCFVLRHRRRPARRRMRQEPSLSVPVLSNTTVSMRASVSRASGRQTRMPSRDRRECAAASAAGTASDRAQGQLITSSASTTSKARAGVVRAPGHERDDGDDRQPQHEPGCDAIGDARHARAMFLCALHQSQQRRQPRRRAAGRDARCAPSGPRHGSGQHGIARRMRHRLRFAGEQRFIEARGASSSRASAGTLARRRPRARRRPAPAAPPARPRAPPSARSRSASTGVARASASTRATATRRARCSSMRAASSRNTNITAASNQTCAPPRIVSSVLAPQASSVDDDDQHIHARAAFPQLAPGAGQERKAGIEHHRCRDQEGEPAKEVARGHRHLVLRVQVQRLGEHHRLQRADARQAHAQQPAPRIGAPRRFLVAAAGEVGPVAQRDAGGAGLPDRRLRAGFQTRRMRPVTALAPTSLTPGSRASARSMSQAQAAQRMPSVSSTISRPPGTCARARPSRPGGPRPQDRFARATRDRLAGCAAGSNRRGWRRGSTARRRRSRRSRSCARRSRRAG